MEPLEQQIVKPKKAIKKRPKLTLQQLEVGCTINLNSSKKQGVHATQSITDHKAVACREQRNTTMCNNSRSSSSQCPCKPHACLTWSLTHTPAVTWNLQKYPWTSLPPLLPACCCDPACRPLMACRKCSPSSLSGSKMATRARVTRWVTAVHESHCSWLCAAYTAWPAALLCVHQPSNLARMLPQNNMFLVGCLPSNTGSASSTNYMSQPR
jgi:hypothetical protein